MKRTRSQQGSEGAAEIRGSRGASKLARGLSGTNLARAGDYNQRTVLQAIRLKQPVTRNDLARQTGLTAPAIANIVNRLAELDLVFTNVRTVGSRGAPSIQLRVNPDGAFSLGLNIDRDHLTMVALDLAGRVRARASSEISFAMPEQVQSFVDKYLPQLIRKGRVIEGRILGLGVAIPDELGTIEVPHLPKRYSVWDRTDVAALLSDQINWPIYQDNDAAAAALGEAQQATALENPSFFYLLITALLGGAPVFDRTYHRGATSRSGEIGLHPDHTVRRPGAVVQDTVSLAALRQRLEQAGRPIARIEELTTEDPLIEAIVAGWLADVTRSLTDPLVSLAFMLNLDAILIGGRLPLPLVKKLAQSLDGSLAAYRIPHQPRILPATMPMDAPAIGAAMLPFLDQLLPSEAILAKAEVNSVSAR